MAYQSPAEGQRINIKSNSNSVIDNGTVTLQQGTLIGLSQSSSTITISRSPEYLEAYMSTNQTTNLGVGDHVKFNGTIATAGSNITLDTSTTYTNGAGASIGRFTLASGHTYWLFGNLTSVVYNTSSDAIYYYWYNVTAGAAIGPTVYNTAPARNNTSQNLVQAPAVGVIITGASTLVELRILAGGTITRLGDTGATPLSYGAVATIRMLS
jgi:hypothetical protein